MRARRKLVLCVIDGLTPAVLERGLERGRLPALAALAREGSYGSAVSTFPSVTPVCLSTLATGGGPDVHGIPHLAWYHRGEGRLVEYGSSFPAVLAAGVRASLRDAVIEMSRSHLAPEARTVFEVLADAGLVTGAVNYTCYRGRRRHAVRMPGPLARNRWYEAVQGPERFFFFNLYESDAVGTPLAIRSRTAGSVDRYAAAAGRWLVTRDGFDFLLYYLPDFDYAAHARGPDGAGDALERADRCLGELLDAAGGPDAFLERYGIVVCSDHAQSPVGQAARLERRFGDLRLHAPRRRGAAELAVTGSNRAAMLYRLSPEAPAPRSLAERLDAEPAVDLALFLEDGAAVARREGEELRFSPAAGGFRLEGDPAVLDPDLYPAGLERAWRALRCPNAGEVVLSAAAGWEFADLAGHHHAGGGSHGSLLAQDSVVPMLVAGLGESPLPRSIAEVQALVLDHFGLGAAEGREAADAA